MLHLLSLAGLSTEIIERIGAGDDVVLQQGLVWAALKGHADNAKLLALFAKHCQVFVLQEMLAVNGIQKPSVLAGVNIIDFSGFVELTVKNSAIHTWC